MKHIFVVNPAAGRKDAEREIVPAIVRAASAAGIDHEIHLTEGPMHAEQLARDACGTGDPVRIYACGGDGTLNEVANGIFGFAHAELAAIPTGTGNDFIRTFENSAYFSDLERQIKGSPVWIDAIRYNGRIGVNVCNTGFDSAVASRIQRLKDIPFIHGKSAYIAGVILEFFKRMGNQLEISIDGVALPPETYLLVAVGSGAYYGGGFRALPLATRSDGSLDVCLVRKFGRLRFLTMIADYKTGAHVEKSRFRRHVRYVKCREATIRSEAPFVFCADGEITMETSVDFAILPKAIRLSLPRGCGFTGA